MDDTLAEKIAEFLKIISKANIDQYIYIRKHHGDD